MLRKFSLITVGITALGLLAGVPAAQAAGRAPDSAVSSPAAARPTVQRTPLVGTVSGSSPVTGIRSMYTYVDRPLSDRSKLSVNVANGNVSLVNTQLHVAGTGLDEAVDLSYNSRADNPVSPGPFPTGWSQSLGRDTRLDNVTGGVLFSGPSGYHVLFTGAHSATSFSSPAGINADLTRNAGTGVYTLSFHQSGERYVFNSTGRLTADIDRNGNQLTFAYTTPITSTSQLTGITDTRGRTTTPAYNAQGREKSLTDSTGRAWTYAYDTAGNLSMATDPAGYTTTYSYDSNGLLQNITDPRGATRSA